MSNATLIAKLRAWREHDFHADRQLADEVLLAAGWSVQPDPDFEGGVRWSYGTNPRYSTSEKSRPHPVNDLQAAVNQRPRLTGYIVGDYDGMAMAECWSLADPTTKYEGSSPNAAVAMCIALLQAYDREAALPSLTDVHNATVRKIVADIVKPTLAAGGTATAVLVVLESVVLGVLLALTRLGGAGPVFDHLMAAVRTRIAAHDLANAPPAGKG